jgi:amino acid permease
VACAYFGWQIVGVRRQRLTALQCFLACLAVTVAYAMLITNVLDVWENNRARYMIDPLMTLIVFAFVYRKRLGKAA